PNHTSHKSLTVCQTRSGSPTIMIINLPCVNPVAPRIIKESIPPDVALDAKLTNDPTLANKKNTTIGIPYRAAQTNQTLSTVVAERNSSFPIGPNPYPVSGRNEICSDT